MENSLTPGVQKIATTPLAWDMPQPNNMPLSMAEQVARISQWHTAIKEKVTLACNEIEGAPENTTAVIALHKALGWIDEAESWTKTLPQTPDRFWAEHPEGGRFMFGFGDIERGFVKMGHGYFDINECQITPA